MAYFLICSFLFLSTYSLIATDVGVYGHVFIIEEEDLLSFLLEKLNDNSVGELINIQNKVQNKYADLIKEPKSVEGLKETTIRRVFYFDPTIYVKQNIQDHEGKTIISKGTSINPLEKISLNENLLFFDATNESHVKWAKVQGANVKWILVKGKPLDLENKESRPVYFDQFGVLTKKFQIQHIPARISQEGLKLKIEEIPVEEELCKNS